MSPSKPNIAIIGAGPAGLMAAEILARAGLLPTVFDRMPSPARKFLLAGRGGLNLTHSEDFPTFLSRYGDDAEWLTPFLEAMPPKSTRAWADGLGAETFVGSSGRVFPKAMKATPLLRAWLKRLAELGVAFRPRHRWCGWDDSGALVFETQSGAANISTDATLLALGGASWPKLGSDGSWVTLLGGQGVAVTRLRPANCGFLRPWSARFKTFAGTPLKGIALSFDGQVVRGEAVITEQGIEGGCLYALSRVLRNMIEQNGAAVPIIDLRPEMSLKDVAARLATPHKGTSQSNRLRKALHLSPVAINLLREIHGVHLPDAPDNLAECIKATPIELSATAAIDRAISTAGGIAQGELDADLQLRRLPGVFVAGEMIDWEAPTGGYLLSGCFATAAAAAKGICRYVRGSAD